MRVFEPVEELAKHPQLTLVRPARQTSNECNGLVSPFIETAHCST
jgi:hypothetical protein